ncbi:MAG: O-antigen ligase family protein [Oscillochloridaceae bacterium umkhey_bin13]
MLTPRFRLIALLALGAILVLAFAGLVWFDNATNRGVTFHPAPTPTSAGGPMLAVNFFNLHLEPDPAAVRRSFELAAAMGARYGRMQVPWDDLEIHARGDFEDRRNLEAIGAVSAWAKYDRLVAEANAAGIELIWRLERPPAWAREQANATPEFQAGLERDGNSTGPPDDLADYANFVRTVVERYDGDGLNDAPGSPTVRHFQIWNEPNLKNEWGWQDPVPEQFVELLRVGATAARAANPDAVILFPGLAPTDGLDSSAPMTELEYLDRVYRAGGAAYFDVMAAQAYGLGQPPDEQRYVFLRGRGNWSWRRPVDTRNDVSRVVLLREVMEANGDHATPIWVTEFGWNSAPETIPPERRLTWGQPVSEETKGAYLVGQMVRAREQWPWMGVMSVWMLRYGGYAEPNPDDPTPYFALVTRDWQILPAYEALRDFATQPAVLGVGAHAWGHAAIEPMAEGWRVRFSGTRLTLLGGLDAEAGPVTGTLNGNPDGLRREVAFSQRVWMTPVLPDGIHTLEFQGNLPPDLLLVERAQPWAWFWDYAGLVLLTGLAALGALTMPLLFQQFDRAIRRVQTIQGHTSGRGGLAARLIQPDALTMLGLLLGIAIAYRGSAQLPITLAGLALFAALALRRPDLALLTIPLTLPLYFIPKGLFDARFGIRDTGIYLPLHEILLLTTLLAGLPTLWREWWVQRLAPGAGGAWGTTGSPQTKKWYGETPGFPVPLLPTALLIIAALWGVIIAEARGPALRELRWLVIEPLLFVGAAALAAAWWQRRGWGDYWLVLVRYWLIGGAIAGLIGLLQFFGLNLAPLFGTKAGFSDDSFLVEGVRRVTSLYGHPNNLGLAMGRYWPLAAALAHGAFWSAPTRDQGLRRAWPYLLVMALGLAGLLASFSRGAYLGAVVAAGVLALVLLPRATWRNRRIWWVGGLLTGGLVVALGLALALGIERLNPFGASGGIRVQTWASALAMLRDHPLGIGLDQFGRLYPNYIAPELVNTNEINTAHPHNLLLDTALRLGPLGLLAFGWLLVGLYRAAWRGVRAGGDGLRGSDPWPALLAGVLAATSASLAHGLVDQFYFWPDLAFAFWLFVGLGQRFVTRPGIA